MINKTTQYTTDPNTIPVDTTSGAQQLSNALDDPSRVSIKPPLVSRGRWKVGEEVIPAGETSDWDAKAIDADIIWDEDNNQVVAVYSGLSDAGLSQTGIAVGEDIYSLSKHPSNPVLTVGATSSWDDAYAFDGYVFEWGGFRGRSEKYAILYCGGQSGGIIDGWGLAYSNDLITWSKDASNPIISSASLGTSAKDPSLVLVDGTYHIFYEYGTPGGSTSIGYVTTADFSTFSVSGSNPVMTDDLNSCQDPQVSWYNGEFYLYFERESSTTGLRTVHFTKSSDPTSFGNNAGSPLLDNTQNADDHTAHLTFFRHDGKWCGVVNTARSDGSISIASVEDSPRIFGGGGAVVHVSNGTTTQSLPQATWTKVDFGTSLYDNLLEWDETTSVYTARYDSLLCVSSQVAIFPGADGTSTTRSFIRLMHNGNRIASGAAIGNGTLLHQVTISDYIIAVKAGDTLQIDAISEGVTGSVDITSGNGYTRLSIINL